MRILQASAISLRMNSLTRQTHIITMPLKQIPSTNETESASSQSEKKRCEGHKKQKRQAVYKPVSLNKSGLLDSNQRPLRPERSTLPTALNPDLFLFCGCKDTNKKRNRIIFSVKIVVRLLKSPISSWRKSGKSSAHFQLIHCSRGFVVVRRPYR